MYGSTDYGLTVDLYPFQVEGVDYILKSKYCILAFDMGLGKTIQAIAAANATKSKCLIVCPAFLKLNWELEIQKFCKTYKHVASYKKALDIYSYTPELEDFVIINYEQVKHAESLFEWADMVVADEAHYLKNGDAQRTIFFDKYLYENEPKYFIQMTGTPIQNRVEELYQLLLMACFTKGNGKNIMTDYPTKSSFCTKFSNKIMQKMRGRYIIKYEGHRNIELLKTYLKGKFIRRKQADVLDLPETIEIDVVASYKQDKRLAREFEEHKQGKEKGISAKEKSARLKAKFTIQYVTNLLEQGIKQVVVFSDHVKPAEEIAEHFGVEAITGKMPTPKRQALVEKFQAGDMQVFSATIGAASTGLTLTAAHHMVISDWSWVPGNMAQAKKRILRIGQTKKCTFHNIIGSFQDAYIQRSLKEKVKTITQVIDT